MSSRRLAFVDLETTGGNPARDRITEIGLVRMIDGEVVDEWSSLVNPQCPIPAEIQALTGITTAMVRDAPSFDALADTVAERLAGWTFVAHNARFDYGFLKGEFRRLDRRFLADVLCTVRLSRRLDPGHARHGLDAVAERHGLGSLDRHRALGDARLIARFYQLMRQTRPADELDAAVAHLLKRPALPPHVAEEELLGLPDEPGVYVLRGVNDLPIYVGKAKNLRERVFAHFYADSRNANDARLAAEVRSISYEETAGEFSALLREIDWIRQSAPLHNVALRKREGCCFIELIDADDPQQLGWRIVSVGSLDPARPAGLHGPFSSRARARAALAAVGREFKLCDRALGIWRDDRPCFSYQVGRCQGLCCGRESAAAHQQRLRQALAALAFPDWPYDGPVEFLDRDPGRGLTMRWQFSHWCRLDARTGEREPFDNDVYRLLKRTLTRQPGAFMPLRGAPTDLALMGLVPTDPMPTCPLPAHGASTG